LFQAIVISGSLLGGLSEHLRVVDAEWVDWMRVTPGYGANFAGGCAGLAYGAVAGYLV